MMTDIEKYIEAYKNINENKDYSKLDELKSLSDKIYNDLSQSIMRESLFVKIDNAPFNGVKKMFESITNKLFSTNRGRKYIGSFIKLIKENEDSVKLYALRELFDKSHDPKVVDKLISESLVYSGIISKKIYKDTTVKVSNLLKEAINYLNLSTDNLNTIINENNSFTDKSIEYVLTNKYTPITLPKHIKMLNEIFTHTVDGDINSTQKEGNMIERIYDSYKNKINESVDSNASIFELYKSQCISLIEEKISENPDISDKLNEIKDKVSIKEYKENSFDNDLKYLIDLKNTLSDNE